ncbi:hypothetical protein EPN95_02910 [Patescibacteria group bacterium]|nr:MAG: hypothetical protein EPN95_02910 [Patescibacteria group bacterium]
MRNAIQHRKRWYQMVLSIGSARKRVLAGVVALVFTTGGIGLAAGAPAFASNIGNSNETPYWEAQYPGTDCFKDTGGSIVGKDVVLTVTDAVVLVVNGGSNDQVYPNPVAGQTGYEAPLNNGGQIPDVSHWIYCSPVTPPPPTHVTPVAPVYTPGTCDAVGTVVATDTTQYTWAASGTTAATYETASAVGNVVLDGQTVYGPYDLSQLSGDACPAPPTAVKPEPPVLTVVCGANNDTVTTPGTEYNNDPQVTETAQFVYVIDPHGTDTPGIITVAATPKDGFTVSQPGSGDTYVIEDAGDALWTFTDANTACPPPPPTAIDCVVNTSIPWSAEPGDHKPVQGPNGLDFKGASVAAIDWYLRVLSGNAQGITYLSVTYAPGGTGQPAQVVVEVLAPYFVTPSDPTGYATLSTNLVAPSGTIDLLAPGIGWSSTHIASGPGSLGSPESYSDLVNQIGVNSLFSAPSLHLLTNSTSGDVSTVVALNSSCGNNDFVPTKPADDVSHTSTTTVDCTSDSQTTITTTTTKPQVWDASATPPGYATDTNPADWTVTDDSPGVTVALTSDQIAESCPDNVITPTGPSYTESCQVTGANTTDAVTTGITYADVLVGNTVTTTATAVAPYVIKFGAQSVWVHTFTGGNASGCYPKALALTGSNWPWYAFFGAVLMLVFGIRMARRHHLNT